MSSDTAQSEKTKAQLEEEELQRMLEEEEKAGSKQPTKPPKEDKNVKQPVSPPPPPPKAEVEHSGKELEVKIDTSMIPEETKKKILNNKEARELAQGYLNSFEADPQLKDNTRFWELIRDRAIRKVGLPLKDEAPQLEPFEDKRAAIFSANIFPSGKFMDKSVAYVEQEEGTETLERLATKQTPFQKGLARYVAWRKTHPLPKRKKSVRISKEAVAVGKLLGGKKDGIQTSQHAAKEKKRQTTKKAVQSKARRTKKGK